MATSTTTRADPNTVYDAIVIGTGISGGWAAKELCEQGLKTLVLERGPMVKHIVDYPTATQERWDLEFRGRNTPAEAARQPKQARTGYVTSPFSRHWFVDDIKHPYSETKRFDWTRASGTAAARCRRASPTRHSSSAPSPANRGEFADRSDPV